MITTAYGYQVPVSGDPSKGTTGWMPGYEFNVNRLNGHTHNGIDSALLTITNFTPYNVVAAAAGWVATGSSYAQTVTVPAGVTEINNYNAEFYISATSGSAPVGARVYPVWSRVTGTTVQIFFNDNTCDVTMIIR